MIVDFPEAKKEIKKALDAVLRQKIKENAPTLSLASKKLLFEGDKMSVYQSDGTKRISEFRVAESQFTIAKKDVPTMTADDIIGKITTAAEDMAGQMERGLFEDLNKSLDENKGWVPGNPSLTPDAILMGMEAMWIDFEDDDRSKPMKPTIIAAPAAVELFKKIESETTEEDRRIFAEKEKIILDKKYEEYTADLA